MGGFSGRPDRIKATNYSLEKNSKGGDSVVGKMLDAQASVREINSQNWSEKKAEHAGTHL